MFDAEWHSCTYLFSLLSQREWWGVKTTRAGHAPRRVPCCHCTVAQYRTDSLLEARAYSLFCSRTSVTTVIETLLCSNWITLAAAAVEPSSSEKEECMGRTRNDSTTSPTRRDTWSRAVSRAHSMEDGFSSAHFQSLLAREKLVLQLPARLPQGEGVISWADRNREAVWICAASRRLGLDVDSVSLAVAILDKVVTGTRVPNKYLNCVAAASVSIAKKLCEDHEEDASLYLDRLRLAYSAAELKRMEMRILDLMSWDAHLPHLVRMISSMLASLGGVWLLAPIRAHIETIVCDSSLMASYKPSTLGLAVVSLLLEATSKHWQQSTQQYMKLIKVDPSEFIRCRDRVSSLWARSFVPSISAFGLLSPGDGDLADGEVDEEMAASVAASVVASPPSTLCGLPLATPRTPRTPSSLASPPPLQPTPC